MATNGSNAPKKLLLKIPPDVYKILLEQQGKKKIECNCQFSLESTIFMIIRRQLTLENFDLKTS